MAYEPVGRASINDDLESRTQYDAASHNSDTAAHSQHRGTGNGAEDSKGPSWSSEAVTKQWPLQSQKLAPMTPLRGLIMIFDVILASMPVMFIALAAIAATLDGKEVSLYGVKVKETLLISPTLFPLLFAALMGRFFRHLGLWLAQRGTTLGRLEQLIGCQSVFSALERQISLGSWSIVGVASILVWLLSPVGGQSALRLLDQETGQIHSTSQMSYLNPMTIMDSMMSDGSSVNNARSVYTSICLTALLSSPKYQSTPMDLWGNVKLPLYRSIENSTSDEWKIVANATSENNTYASLIGIPVAGTFDGVRTFNIKARQWDVTCSSNERTDEPQPIFGRNYTWQLDIMNDTTTCSNGTECSTPICTRYPCPIQSLSIADSIADFFTITKCGLTFENYEAEVKCAGKACAVQKMRRIGLIDDEYPIGYDIALRKIALRQQLQFMPNVDNYNIASAIARGSNNMERWMMDPSDFIGIWSVYVRLWELSPELFGDRFTIMFNTFWQSTYGTPALAGNLPAAVSQTGWLNGSSASNISFVPMQASVVSDTRPMYRTNWRWFTALMVCSVILLMAAYMALVLKYITIAPDIIGYASSLTILNPYVPTPTGGSTLNGLERASLLRDMPVRIGDVSPNEPVGVIALARADMDQVARLDKQRSYM